MHSKEEAAMRTVGVFLIVLLAYLFGDRWQRTVWKVLDDYAKWRAREGILLATCPRARVPGQCRQYAVQRGWRSPEVTVLHEAHSV